MAQAQPSDIGFGYIAQADEHVEVPMTPASPLKSAMKMPGANSRWEANPLSPTFHEEQVLEKKEVLTEKEQAKDLVCYAPAELSVLHKTNFLPESQDQSPGGQVPTARRQLQLQSDRPVHALHDPDHLQCHQNASHEEQPPSVGRGNQDLAAVGSPRDLERITSSLRHRLHWLLQRRPQTSREGRGILHPLRRRLLHLQHRHVGYRGRHPPGQQGQR